MTKKKSPESYKMRKILLKLDTAKGLLNARSTDKGHTNEFN